MPEELNIWADELGINEPAVELKQKPAGSLMAGHNALVRAFDIWIASDKYPQARNVGDVADILAHKFIPPAKEVPFVFKPPTGSIPVHNTEASGEQP